MTNIKITSEWGYAGGDVWMGDDLQGKYLARSALTSMANEVPVTIWYSFFFSSQ